MTHNSKKLKRIAAITMARNDDFFLSRWIEYYGAQIGTENLYIYLDGTDQNVPKNAGNAHVKKLPHTDMSRAAGDKYRINLMSDLAADLFARGYDIVIAETSQCAAETSFTTVQGRAHRERRVWGLLQNRQ